MPHIHLAMATKPPQLDKASFTLYKYYDIFNQPVVAKWSKTPISQIQVRNAVAWVPGLNPAWDYDSNCSELEIRGPVHFI